MIKIGAYKRKIKKGLRWRYAGSYAGVYYCSKSQYLNKKEAQDAEREEIKRIKKRLKNPKPEMSLFKLCEKRLDYLEMKSKKYYKDNRRTFRKIIACFGKDLDIENVTKGMIHQFLLDEATRLKKAGRDQYETNAQLKYIRALFNYAIDDLEVLEINPTRKLKFYGTEKRLKYIPPAEHMQMVCEWCHSDQQRLITFVKHSAARISEAIRVTGDDIDLDLNLLTLWTRKKKYGDLTPRRIELPKPIKGLKKEGRLFPEWSQYPRFLEKTCKELKIKSYGWHAYRHLKASQMAAENIPITEIQYFLGHESIVITSNYLRILGFNKY